MTNKINMISTFKLSFFSLFGISFLLNFISLNENFLIGGLFTIGFFTVLQLIRLNFTESLTFTLININNQFILRQKRIFFYKCALPFLIFFFLGYIYFKLKGILINIKIKFLTKKYTHLKLVKGYINIFIVRSTLTFLQNKTN